MQRSEKRSRYEASLARASRALWSAINAAEQCNDPGAAEDATAIRTEVHRLLEDSTNGKRRPRSRQLKLEA